MKKKIIFPVSILLSLLIVGIEILVRLLGLIDFPLYYADNVIGYIPRPSQSGAFIRKNEWQFNSLSMQNDNEFSPTNEVDNLIIGDSIVYGGNPYRKEDRLGQQLANLKKEPVWSISAGSWALRNSLAYLRTHKEVVNGVDKIIFILNSGDFGKASSWTCEYSHPRNYPLVASLYLFKKYIYRSSDECSDVPSNDLLVLDGNWKSELSEELSKPQYAKKEIIIFLYPDINELHYKQLDILENYGKEIIRAGNNALFVYSLGGDTRWNEEFYKDGIHPTALGMKQLASIIHSPQLNTRIMN